jgi:Zn-dependent protease
MRWSIRIARIAGIDVKIHLTFLLLLAWIWYMYYRIGGTVAAWQGILFILLLFGCVLLHEFGHAFAARFYGIKTPDITLLPIGGVARLERMPENPKHELVVALAGPAVNVALAMILFFAHVLVNGGYAVRWEWSALLLNLAVVNVTLAVFNMLPAFPMDGGRVLRAAMALRLDRARATEIAARVGKGMAVIFVVVGMFVNPMLAVIGVFVWVGAGAEAAQTERAMILAGVTARDAMLTHFSVLREDATLDDAVRLTLAGFQPDFPVVDGGHCVGILPQTELLRALTASGSSARVGDVMQRTFSTAELDEPLDAVLIRMVGSSTPIAIVEQQGVLVGLVTLDLIAEVLAIRGALRRVPPRPPASVDRAPPLHDRPWPASAG